MESYYSEKGPHPVWKIWLKTQEVIAERISNTSKKQMFMLLVIYGLAFSLDNASIRNMGERHEFPILLIVCAIVAPLAGLFTWFIGSAVLHGMSRLLGGTGSFKETRTALGVGNRRIQRQACDLGSSIVIVRAHDVYRTNSRRLLTDPVSTSLSVRYSLKYLVYRSRRQIDGRSPPIASLKRIRHCHYTGSPHHFVSIDSDCLNQGGWTWLSKHCLHLRSSRDKVLNGFYPIPPTGVFCGHPFSGWLF